MRFQRKEIPGFNPSSMADVAFLLLIFFLMVSSMEPNTGIYRQLANASPEDVLKKSIDIRDRNLMRLRIDESNRLYLENEEISLAQLKPTSKIFIENPENQDYLPEKERFEITGIGEYSISNQHVIQLEVSRKSNYQTYISVLSELTASYNELREEFAEKQFLKPFSQLSEEQKDVILEIYPQRISEEETEEGGLP
jgi:Biopolymer transport protein